MKYKLSEIAGVAKVIAREIDPQKTTILAMEGELGAGKTAVTKALAKELGIKDEVVSPTFVLHIPHMGKRMLHHIDLWRMEEFGELEQIELQRMIDQKSIIILEWADKFRHQVQRYKGAKVQVVWVKIEYSDKEDERIILISNYSN